MECPLLHVVPGEEGGGREEKYVFKEEGERGRGRVKEKGGK